MTQAMIQDMERRGILEVGFAQVPPLRETLAKPHPDKVVVFRDFFATGLCFPLDAAVVEIFTLFGIFLHQMTPTSFLRLSLYMWLTKTCKLKPSPVGFACLFRCHYQPKVVVVPNGDETSEAEPQFGVYTFAFRSTVPSPMVAYRNKWGTGPRCGSTTRSPSMSQRRATLWR